MLSQGQKALGRELRLGDAQWSLLKGVSLSDLAVSEKGGFSAGTFAEAARLSVRPQWRALLRRDLIVDTISLEGLRLTVVKRADGRYNFSDIAGSTATSPAPGSGAEAAAPLALAVRSAALSDARVVYRDAASGEILTVSELDLTVRNFRMKGSFDAALSVASAGRYEGRALDGTLSLAGKIDLGGIDPEKAALELKRFSVEHQGLKVAGSGKAKGLAAPALDLAVSVSAAAGKLLEARYEGTAGPGQRAKGKLSGKSEGFTGAAFAAFGASPSLALPKGELNADFEWSGDSLALKSLKLKGELGMIEASGSVAKLRAARPEADLAFSAALELPALKGGEYPQLSWPAGLATPAAKIEAKGGYNGESLALERLVIETEAGQATLKGRADALLSGKPALDLGAELRLKLPAFSDEDLPWAKLPEGLALPAGAWSGSIAYRGDDLTLAPLVFEPQAGRVKVEGSLRGLSAGKTAYDLSVEAKLELPAWSAKDLPWAKLPEGFKLPAGTVSGKALYRGDALTLAPLDFVTSAGRVEIEGSIKSLGAARPAYDLSVETKLELPAWSAQDLPWAKLPTSVKVPAGSLAGKASYRGDDLSFSPLSFSAKDGRLKLDGSIKGLSSAKPAYDLAVDAKLELPALAEADLAQFKAPKGFWSPAMQLELDGQLRGGDLRLNALKVKTAAGLVEASGLVRKLLEKPEPELSLGSKLVLPAWKTDDLAWAGFPAGYQIPASSWDASLAGGLDELNIRSLRVIVGKNDVEVENGKIVALRGGAPLFNLLVKCRSFSLEELTAFSAETREMGLSGSGFFAVQVTGKLPKPILEGKLQFKTLGATVSGLPLSGFTGTVSFNERLIEVPNLVGRLADGELKLNLTIKDYATAPKIDLDAALDRFDLGKFLAAKAALAAKAPTAAAASAKPAEPAKAPTPIDAKGRLIVATMLHPNAEARDLRVNWDLEGYTPDFKKLGGSAKFESNGGKFSNLQSMATQSKLVKVLIVPFMIFQKLKVFKDFNNVNYTGIVGDYAFQNGNMTLKDSRLLSDAGNVFAAGAIDLPAERLALVVNAHPARLPALEVEVKGTFDDPKSKLNVAKILAEPAKKLLDLLKK